MVIRTGRQFSSRETRRVIQVEKLIDRQKFKHPFIPQWNDQRTLLQAPSGQERFLKIRRSTVISSLGVFFVHQGAPWTLSPVEKKKKGREGRTLRLLVRTKKSHFCLLVNSPTSSRHQRSPGYSRHQSSKISGCPIGLPDGASTIQQFTLPGVGCQLNLRFNHVKRVRDHRCQKTSRHTAGEMHCRRPGGIWEFCHTGKGR
jgi:hypothetical protein